jgi:hypothetical protein
VVDAVNRLGKEVDLAALDLMLSLRKEALLGVYSNALRGSHPGQSFPAFEERLVKHYGDARVAMYMLQGIDRYQSRALFELLHADVAKARGDARR